MTRPPLTRVQARNCFLANQFATPGMGSLMARRWIAGTGQLLVAVTGFTVFCVGFARMCVEYYQIFRDQTDSGLPSFRLLLVGMAVFALSWVWALFTSLSLRRAAAAGDPSTPDASLFSTPSSSGRPPPVP